MGDVRHRPGTGLLLVGRALIPGSAYTCGIWSRDLLAHTCIPNINITRAANIYRLTLSTLLFQIPLF
jgi:hypothetical protein